jgi:hypothetical protein
VGFEVVYARVASTHIARLRLRIGVLAVFFGAALIAQACRDRVVTPQPRALGARPLSVLGPCTPGGFDYYYTYPDSVCPQNRVVHSHQLESRCYPDTLVRGDVVECRVFLDDTTQGIRLLRGVAAGAVGAAEFPSPDSVTRLPLTPVLWRGVAVESTSVVFRVRYRDTLNVLQTVDDTIGFAVNPRTVVPFGLPSQPSLAVQMYRPNMRDPADSSSSLGVFVA